MQFAIILATICQLLLCTASWAQDEGAPPADRGLTQTLVMFAIVALFFYFIIWRPEQKRRKALEQQRSALKKGDRVTAMGTIGTVMRIEDQTVIIRMYDGSKIEFLKAAISEIHPEASASELKEREKDED